MSSRQHHGSAESPLARRLSFWKRGLGSSMLCWWEGKAVCFFAGRRSQKRSHAAPRVREEDPMMEVRARLLLVWKKSPSIGRYTGTILRGRGNAWVLRFLCRYYRASRNHQGSYLQQDQQQQVNACGLGFYICLMKTGVLKWLPHLAYMQHKDSQLSFL